MEEKGLSANLWDSNLVSSFSNHMEYKVTLPYNVNEYEEPTELQVKQEKC